jgi:WhiB family redox-sensing transcriptional regulator
VSVRVGRPRSFLAELVDDPPWRAEGACHPSRRPAHIPAEWFTATEALAEPLARQLCWRCPVRHTCLEWAMAHHESGLWGGYTTEERRRMVRRRRAFAAAIAAIEPVSG